VTIKAKPALPNPADDLFGSRVKQNLEIITARVAALGKYRRPTPQVPTGGFTSFAQVTAAYNDLVQTLNDIVDRLQG
jgi:hypothetical protein